MATLVFNLILASATNLLAFSILTKPPIHWDAEAILYAVVAPRWLAAAIGLFFKKRLAWCGSLLGAGTMACSSVTIIGWGAVLAPAAQDPTDGAGYAIFTGVLGLVMSLTVIAGLVRIRKNLRCERTSMLYAPGGREDHDTFPRS